MTDEDQQGDWTKNADDNSAIANEMTVLEESDFSHSASQLTEKRVITTEEDIDEGYFERPQNQQKLHKKPKCLKPQPH
jgi:hypothetical protein